MAIEIEKKYRLTEEQRERILADLQELKAKYTGEDFEENTLYGGGILDEQRAALRVRKIGNKTVLTYKRRIQNNSEIKHQIEHETEVENAEEIENIIQCLGFEKSLVYEKRRKIWKFRNVEIVLDELPFGLYMEIEGSAMEIREAEMILGAEEFNVENETYPHLTMKSGKKKEKIIEARFTGLKSSI